MSWLPLYLNRRSLSRMEGSSLHADLRLNIGWSLALKNGDSSDLSFDPEEAFVLDALAREALFLKSLGRSWPKNWPDGILTAHPIQGCEQSLENLIKSDWACALFPIDCGDGRAAAGLVWVGENGQRHIDPPNVTGDSWQLAAELAEFVVSRPKGFAARRRLALEFIASGQVEEGRVMSVSEGHKMNLEVPGRIWLAPALGWSGANSISVNSVTDAVSIVSDELTHDAGVREEWPADVTCVHTIVSAALMPIIEVILCARPERVCLWMSDMKGSKGFEELIRSFFESSLPAPYEDYNPQFEVRSIVSNNLTVMERQLRMGLQDSESSGKVVFNITNGNRLQGNAALNMMRLLKAREGRLVYRNIDCKVAGEMVEIRFEPQRKTASTRIVSAGDRLSGFRSEKFWDREFEPKSLEALRKGLIK